MTSYDFAVNAFNSIIGYNGKPFGKGKGVSDGREGVQWNISVNPENGETKLGVNLEGKEYINWPISTFLKEELGNLRLLSLANITGANKINIKLERDAWQGLARPSIKEKKLRVVTLCYQN